MKKKLFKTAFATVCVVAAGMGCFKAYNASNQSESSMLLAENVEALSDKDGDKGHIPEKTHWVPTNERRPAPNGTGKQIPMNKCEKSKKENDYCIVGTYQYDYKRYYGG